MRCALAEGTGPDRIDAVSSQLRRSALSILFLGLLFGFFGYPGSARGQVAIGGQIGSPSGVNLKIQGDSEPAVDLLAAFDLDDFFFLNGHLLYEEELDEEANLHVLYGPGAFIGVHDRPVAEDEVGVGISATVGLGIYVRQFEIYGRVTPRLAVLPTTNGDVGGGIGVRWFF